MMTIITGKRGSGKTLLLAELVYAKIGICVPYEPHMDKDKFDKALRTDITPECSYIAIPASGSWTSRNLMYWAGHIGTKCVYSRKYEPDKVFMFPDIYITLQDDRIIPTEFYNRTDIRIIECKSYSGGETNENFKKN